MFLKQFVHAWHAASFCSGSVRFNTNSKRGAQMKQPQSEFAGRPITLRVQAQCGIVAFTNGGVNVLCIFHLALALPRILLRHFGLKNIESTAQSAAQREFISVSHLHRCIRNRGTGAHAGRKA